MLSPSAIFDSGHTQVTSIRSAITVFEWTEVQQPKQPTVRNILFANRMTVFLLQDAAADTIRAPQIMASHQFTFQSARTRRIPRRNFAHDRILQ